MVADRSSFGFEDCFMGTPVDGWVLRHGAPCDLRANATLFAQGQPSHELYWLERGSVMLRRSEGTGSDIIIGFRGEGTLLGAHALTPDALAPAS